MYNIDNKEIGKYLSKLIDEKYRSKRQFCIAYIEVDKGTADDTEIRNMSNRVSQIIKGTKAIQIHDLPIFTKLLGVTCDAILSAGNCLVPDYKHMTNYIVAFSKDKSIWEQYIHQEDKAILNPDEYGKTVIDYALAFKNYEFLGYLMEHHYIWFVDADKQNYYSNFGAGTSIEHRKFYETDLLNIKLVENDNLRMQMISLAIEHDDFAMLKQLRAREIPTLYQISYITANSAKECDRYYNEDMVVHVSKASEQILIFFAEEFEITDFFKKTNTFLFPYMSNLLDILIRNNSVHLETMLNVALKHNQKAYEQISTLICEAIEERLSNYKETPHYHDKKYFQYIKKEMTDSVMRGIDFQDNGSFVNFYDGERGMITNVIHTTMESKNEKMQTLIQNLNDLYEKIRAKDFEFDVR